MADAIEILPATWRDLRGAWALEKACFGRDAWSLVEIFISLVSPNVRLKAATGRRVVGLVIGETHLLEGCAWIATLGVHPEFQGRGLGARLLVAAEARLTSPVIKLTVRPTNAPAIALYRKFGYAPTRTLEHYYAGGESGLVMEKGRLPQGNHL